MFGRGYQPARGPRFSQRPLPVVASHSGGSRHVGRAFSAWGAGRLAARDRPPEAPNHHASLGSTNEAFEERDLSRHWRVSFAEDL